jgi:hypothetical protein
VIRDHGWESIVDLVEQTLLRVKDGQGAINDVIQSRQMPVLPEA